MVEPGQKGPRPYNVTNYNWHPAPDQAIPMLEAHVHRLSQWRNDLALEAEYLWRVLSQHEAEYHNTASDSNEKLEKRKIVELLGGMHNSLWTRASQYDWMLADARKRLEQMRTAATDREGKVTWSLSQAADHNPLPRAILEETSSRLERFLANTEQRKYALESARMKIKEEIEKKGSVGPVASIWRAFSDEEANGEDLARALEEVEELIKAAEFDASMLRKAKSELGLS
jgi:hypothetical protein